MHETEINGNVLISDYYLEEDYQTRGPLQSLLKITKPQFSFP